MINLRGKIYLMSKYLDAHIFPLLCAGTNTREESLIMRKVYYSEPGLLYNKKQLIYIQYN